MDLAEMCEQSFYQEIYRYEGTNRSIVLDTTTDHIYLKKELRVYSREVFAYLKQHRSPHIPQVRAFWEENGRMAVIEEFIQGETLASLLERKALRQQDIPRILAELCDGLEFLHGAVPPIIHRDLKPSNVMIDDGGTVRLIDYDAAKVFHPEASEDTVLMGTRGSAAPEQYGFGQSDERTDVYGLGMLIRKIAPENPRLLKIADKATELDPANRYQSIAEMRKAIREVFPKIGRSAAGTGSSFAGIRRNSAGRGIGGQGWEQPVYWRRNVPGFRTNVWWKMVLAIGIYALIVSIALTAPVNSGGVPVTDPFDIAVFRTCLGLACLSVVDMFAEGSWIARHLPWGKSSNPVIWLLVHSAAAFLGFFFWAFVSAMLS